MCASSMNNAGLGERARVHGGGARTRGPSFVGRRAAHRLKEKRFRLSAAPRRHQGGLGRFLALIFCSRQIYVDELVQAPPQRRSKAARDTGSIRRRLRSGEQTPYFARQTQFDPPDETGRDILGGLRKEDCSEDCNNVRPQRSGFISCALRRSGRVGEAETAGLTGRREGRGSASCVWTGKYRDPSRRIVLRRQQEAKDRSGGLIRTYDVRDEKCGVLQLA